MPWLLAAAAASLVVAFIRRSLIPVTALSFVALLLGAGRGTLTASPELPSSLIGQNVLLTGTVDDDPVDRKATRRLTVRADRVLTGAGQSGRNLRIEATVYGLSPVHYGDLVLLDGELQKPPRFEQFDYRTYLAEQGIAGVMPSTRLIRVTSHAGDPFHTALFALRHALIDAADRALPEPQAALLLGVVFGYRAALPPLLQQQMIASGLIRTVLVHTHVRRWGAASISAIIWMIARLDEFLVFINRCPYGSSRSATSGSAVASG